MQYWLGSGGDREIEKDYISTHGTELVFIKEKGVLASRIWKFSIKLYLVSMSGGSCNIRTVLWLVY